MAESIPASLDLKDAWKEFPSIENANVRLMSKVAPDVRSPKFF
jgi:hypothetical protein